MRGRLPSFSLGALRSLRVQVVVALLLAAAICAYLANKASGDELAGAYRDSGNEVLDMSGRAFTADFRPEQLGTPQVLRRNAGAVRAMHPDISSVAVYWPEKGPSGPLAGTSGTTFDPRLESSVRTALTNGRVQRSEVRDGDRHLTERILPLKDGGRTVAALVLDYDLRHYDEALAERNERILLVLGALLLTFTAFTAFTLGRGIFHPIDRLRKATHEIRSGRLDSRLDWRRRDELGTLAADFDSMAGELEEQHRRLEALALADPLTGLANHRRFQELLSAEVARAEREDNQLALLLLDIDHFKRVNDSRGHPFGDRVLASVGQSLARAVRGTGLAARLGGDEFAVLLAGAGEEEAKEACEVLQQAVRSADTDDYEITASVGYAFYPADAPNAPALFQLADGALYWAKGTGRNRTRRYDPEHVLVVTEEQRAEFAALVERPGMVTAVFQPIVGLADGNIVGYESLARFADERRRLPTWWFEQAHRFGLGHKLEAEAVRRALSTTGRPTGTFQTVNVSPSALVSSAFRDCLPDDLSDIVIEITEHEQIVDEEALDIALVPIRNRGATIAVDDAGAGYASLRQVMRLRAEVVKLDRALVEGVDVDPTKAALVRSLVDFARDTGATLCAEGIETEGELRTLRDLGVAQGQGYFLARPGTPWPALRPEAAAVWSGQPTQGERRLTVVSDQTMRRQPA